MTIKTVIGGMIFEVSNRYIENKSSSELSTRVVSKTTLEECLIGNNDLAFFLQTFDVCPLFLPQKTFFADEWARFRIVWIVTSKTLCTLIPRWGFLSNF